MIAIEGGYENQDVNLRKIQDWAEGEFAYLSGDYRYLIATYISELYTLAFISKAQLQGMDEKQGQLAAITNESIKTLEAELRSYHLVEAIEKIRRKIVEVGGLIPD